jgi:pilus assembly protein CpaF
MAVPRPEQAGNAAQSSEPTNYHLADGGAMQANGHSGLKRRLHQHLLAALTQGRLEHAAEGELRRELARLAEEWGGQVGEAMDSAGRATLIEEVLEEVYSYHTIEKLLEDHDISDILINGPRQLFIERHGQLQATDVSFHDEDHLLQVISRMISQTGRRLDKSSPMVDARLPDGSRLNAVLKPPALNGPLVSIRRFGVRPLTADDLAANESIAREMLEFLAGCVKSRLSMIISGGTGSGKTTLLNALSRWIPNSERLVTIEDTAELALQQPNVAKLESIPSDGNGSTTVTIRDLVKNALRMRPDRIIVGECRGAEALEMLQAMNTGHEGSLTTIHANSPRDALSRIELMVGLAGVDIPVWAVRKLIAASIHLVVQVSRLSGGKRKIVSISEITGMESDTVSMHEIFNFVQSGVDRYNVVEGYFCCTGIRPHCLKKLMVSGAQVPVEMFRERRLQPQQPREPSR